MPYALDFAFLHAVLRNEPEAQLLIDIIRDTGEILFCHQSVIGEIINEWRKRHPKGDSESLRASITCVVSEWKHGIINLGAEVQRLKTQYRFLKESDCYSVALARYLSEDTSLQWLASTGIQTTSEKPVPSLTPNHTTFDLLGAAGEFDSDRFGKGVLIVFSDTLIRRNRRRKRPL